MDEDLEFWEKAGTQITLQEELVELLNKCKNNSFVTQDGGTMIQSNSGTNCKSLRFRQKEPGTVHIYCQECGIVCPVRLADETATFPESAVEDAGDELDEFISIAGADVDDEDDDDYGGDYDDGHADEDDDEDEES